MQIILIKLQIKSKQKELHKAQLEHLMNTKTKSLFSPLSYFENENLLGQ